MLLLLVPLYGLYEFAILAIRLTHWRAARRGAGGLWMLRAKCGPECATGEGWQIGPHFVG